jgi:hypothetical protein
VLFRVRLWPSHSVFVSRLPSRWIWSVVNNDVTNQEASGRR